MNEDLLSEIKKNIEKAFKEIKTEKFERDSIKYTEGGKDCLKKHVNDFAKQILSTSFDAAKKSNSSEVTNAHVNQSRTIYDDRPYNRTARLFSAFGGFIIASSSSCLIATAFSDICDFYRVCVSIGAVFGLVIGTLGVSYGIFKES